MGIMQRAMYHDTVLTSVSDGKIIYLTWKSCTIMSILFSKVKRFLKILGMEQDISEWPKCQMTSHYIPEQPSETGHIIIIF